METASIANTEYSFRSEKHPELQLLARARSDYSQFSSDPFTGIAITPGRTEVTRGDGDAASSTGTETDSVDPAILIIPTSSKAYSGVARYIDFISSLPVHLSKCILGYLDQPSLFNALCVSSKWRSLVEEVHQEHFVSQSLWEEVMLMQVRVTFQFVAFSQSLSSLLVMITIMISRKVSSLLLSPLLFSSLLSLSSESWWLSR